MKSLGLQNLWREGPHGGRGSLRARRGQEGGREENNCSSMKNDL